MRRIVLLAALFAASAPRVAAADEPGLGVDPSRPRVGDDDSDEEESSDAGGADEDGFRFQFHGYLRVPGRVGIGKVDGAPGRKLHAPPHIPDSQYTDWRFTNNIVGPWTELWFNYGNGRVSANVEIAAYNVTDGGYKDLVSQLGITESFITIKAPHPFGSRVNLAWNVGAFSNRYGTAGVYDAGKYDTYLFGATHVAGETLAASYDVSEDLQIEAEHGVGGKIEPIPFQAGPDGSPPDNPFGPYPGDVEQGATFLHHAHIGATWQKQLTAALHYLTAWTDDADLATEHDGRITVVGAEAKLINSRWGNGYLGFAHLRARDALRVSGAIETLHSFEGWELRDNYFPGNPDGEDASGTGTMNTVLFEYTFSLATYFWHPQEFYGQGPDLTFSAFGMFNQISSDDPAFAGAKQKLKLGGEVVYTPLTWLGVAARYDLVQPNMDDARESFHVITPRMILRSEFASHEEVWIQYSQYLNGSRVRSTAVWPYEPTRADDAALAITAVMWW